MLQHFEVNYEDRAYTVLLSDKIGLGSKISLRFGWGGSKGQFKVVSIKSTKTLSVLGIMFIGPMPEGESMAGMAHLIKSPSLSI